MRASLEDLLVLVDARHHVGDDVLVLAAQLAKIGELLGDAPLARFETSHTSLPSAPTPSASPRRRDPASRNESRRQRVLERKEAAPFEQRVVAVDLRQESLLRGDGEDLRRRKREKRRRCLDLAADLRSDRRAA
jgi:hypothetical protein